MIKVVSIADFCSHVLVWRWPGFLPIFYVQKPYLQGSAMDICFFAGRHHCLPAFYFSAPAAIPKFEGGEDRQQTKAGSPGQTYAARGRAIS
ncbi:hypothetical protein [Pseudoflavonifractor capillosus]|uniref:hypothetical protein n=1 Tax=Pseudoflavonifractor capillosus TaxID=106588 RepID=UPI0023F6680B|nr:hypothetical protein [Pseudoflavonifractor capillosus]